MLALINFETKLESELDFKTKYAFDKESIEYTKNMLEQVQTILMEI